MDNIARFQAVVSSSTVICVAMLCLAVQEKEVSAADDQALKEILEDTDHIRQLPDDAMVYMFRGSTWLRMGKYHLAVLDYTKALQSELQRPNSVWTPSDVRPQVFTERGIAWLKLGKYGAAVADFENVLRVTERCIHCGKPLEDHSSRPSADDAKPPQRDATDRMIASTACIELSLILSSCPEEAYRSAARAAALANTVHRMADRDKDQDDPAMALLAARQKTIALSLMAAASAEQGDFEQAISLQEQAIRACEGGHDLQKYRSQLQEYRHGRPNRLPPGRF